MIIINAIIMLPWIRGMQNTPYVRPSRLKLYEVKVSVTENKIKWMNPAI